MPQEKEPPEMYSKEFLSEMFKSKVKIKVE